VISHDRRNGENHRDQPSREPQAKSHDGAQMRTTGVTVRRVNVGTASKGF
jgi:hypothetical protein